MRARRPRIATFQLGDCRNERRGLMSGNVVFEAFVRFVRCCEASRQAAMCPAHFGRGTPSHRERSSTIRELQPDGRDREDKQDGAPEHEEIIGRTMLHSRCTNRTGPGKGRNTRGRKPLQHAGTVSPAPATFGWRAS